jgi:hypothetical protein
MRGGYLVEGLRTRLMIFGDKHLAESPRPNVGCYIRCIVRPMKQELGFGVKHSVFNSKFQSLVIGRLVS